ncbi:hypothetical protein CGMCC3_g13363 [Colletotrichum fructicola]|nr:uncharacterized protein CGMCC3_g13363 [Colletotrichum fructicola]KAE9570603.1 hypothetical protein CGMCC3_g13363 [Colletotrichum fructicola]
MMERPRSTSILEETTPHRLRPPTYTATQHQIAIVGTSPVISALTADIFNTPDTPDTAPAIQQTKGLDNPLQLSRPLGPAPSSRRQLWIRLDPPTSSPKRSSTSPRQQTSIETAQQTAATTPGDPLRPALLGGLALSPRQ